MRVARWIAAGIALTLLVSGCGSGEETATGDKPPRPPQKPQSVSLTLDGLPGPETAAVSMAAERGYFTDVGLEVLVMAPSHPPRPLWYTANRTVDVAISHEPQVVLSAAKGAPVVAVGSIVAEPTMAMIWLKKSGINGIADLKGKTVAYPGVLFQKKLLEAVLSRAGLTLADVKLERVDYDLVPALVSGRADAIFGGSWNVEGVELEERGLDPEIVRVSDLGIPPYDELVVIARRDRVAKEPELFRRFLAAVARGAAAAAEDPEAATKAIARHRSEYEDVNRKALEAGVEATLPLLSETGQVEPGRLTDLVDWMREEGLLRREPPSSALLVVP